MERQLLPYWFAAVAILAVVASGHADAQTVRRWTNTGYANGLWFTTPQQVCDYIAPIHPNNCSAGNADPVFSTTGFCNGWYASNGVYGCMYEPLTSQLQTDCSEGELWDPLLGQCTPIEAPCPAGQVRDTFSYGGQDYTSCIPELPDPDCLVIGYDSLGNEQCIDPNEPNQCVAGGGQFVFDGSTGRCIDEDPPIDPEVEDNCQPQQVFAIVGDTSTCLWLFPDSPNQDDIGNPVDSDDGPDGGGQPDTDGDGIPNSSDSDIDGDGTPNSGDPDMDGDGTPNSSDLDMDGDGIPNQRDGDIDGDGVDNSADNDADGDGIDNDTDTDDDGDGVPDGEDSTPTGENVEEGTEEEETVGGGGNCAESSKPTCSGSDPIACAILQQTWATRCALEGPVDVNEVLDALGNPDAAELFTDDTDVEPFLSGVLGQDSVTSNCPAPISINVGGTSLNVEFTPFCDLATNLRPLVLLIFSLISARILFRAMSGA